MLVPLSSEDKLRVQEQLAQAQVVQDGVAIKVESLCILALSAAAEAEEAGETVEAMQWRAAACSIYENIACSYRVYALTAAKMAERFGSASSQHCGDEEGELDDRE